MLTSIHQIIYMRSREEPRNNFWGDSQSIKVEEKMWFMEWTSNLGILAIFFSMWCSRPWNLKDIDEISSCIYGSNFKHWFTIILEIWLKEVRLLKCNCNPLQIGKLSTFAINFVIWYFWPWNMEDTDKISSCTCDSNFKPWFTIISKICLNKVRLPECS